MWYIEHRNGNWNIGLHLSNLTFIFCVVQYTQLKSSVVPQSLAFSLIPTLKYFVSFFSNITC